jgi:DNA-binding response OmpR family regulator
MRTNEKVWILEDDESARFVYQECLGFRYNLFFFETLTDLRVKADFHADNHSSFPDLVIADLRLPDGDFLTYISQENSLLTLNTPFIVVSSIDDLDVLRACFEEGARDYLTKPFSKNELIVKVQRILGPPQAKEQFELDPMTLRVKKSDSGAEAGFAQLTARELQIFSVLRKNIQNGVSRKDLLKQVWSDTAVTTKTLDVHLFNIRRKLSKIGIEIKLREHEILYLSGNGVHENLGRSI